jgi:replicative DNA helicase
MTDARSYYSTSSGHSSRSLDRALPKDIEAERQVLGAMLLEPDVIPQIIHTLSSEDFWPRKHQLILSAIVELFESNKPTDLVSVGHHLERNNKLDEIGGRAYLSELISRVTSTASVSYYAEILRDLSLKRKAYAAAIQFANAALNGKAAPDVLLQAKAALEALTTEALQGSEDVLQGARFVFSSPDQLTAVSSVSVIDGLKCPVADVM